MSSFSNAHAACAFFSLVVLSLLSLPVILFVTITSIASIVAWLLPGPSLALSSLRHSALYIGNVWHTRLHPKKHAFTYPIFMFALDLDEWDVFRKALWPLTPWIIDFRDTDHLKNGEGLDQLPSKPKRNNNNNNSSNGFSNSIGTRIMRLVAQKTNNSFRPTQSTHRIMILTHLCYYGYNFNPVSFYYVIDKESNEVEAMVGEVSNTPWTEMYCYVLHPDSTDDVAATTTTTTTKASLRKVEYSFPKAFHVSPFMEMEYWYDWTFVGIPEAPDARNRSSPTESGSSPTSSCNATTPLTVINTLRRRGTDRIEFTAKLIMDGHRITPRTIAWQLLRFPFFCIMIQIWIHYQAALLFIKGVVYIPHPEGSETKASKIIASIMIPFFAIRDRLHTKSKTA